jgi:hypothetical protein
MKRLLVMAVLVVTALGLSTGLTSSPARASAGPHAITISLSANQGGSATWSAKRHSGTVTLCVAGAPSTANAVITLHHFASTLPSAEPTFTASVYSSGTPRWVITFSNGDTAFGYPASSGLAPTNWELNSSGVGITYAALQSAEAANTVTSVYIVLDGSAGTPYCTIVSAIVYDGQTLTS